MIISKFFACLLYILTQTLANPLPKKINGKRIKGEST